MPNTQIGSKGSLGTLAAAAAEQFYVTVCAVVRDFRRETKASAGLSSG